MTLNVLLVNENMILQANDLTLNNNKALVRDEERKREREIGRKKEREREKNKIDQEIVVNLPNI